MLADETATTAMCLLIVLAATMLALLCLLLLCSLPWFYIVFPSGCVRPYRKGTDWFPQRGKHKTKQNRKKHQNNQNNNKRTWKHVTRSVSFISGRTHADESLRCLSQGSYRSFSKDKDDPVTSFSRRNPLSPSWSCNNNNKNKHFVHLFSRAWMPLLAMDTLTFKSAPGYAAPFIGVQGLNSWLQTGRNPAARLPEGVLTRLLQHSRRHCRLKCQCRIERLRRGWRGQWWHSTPCVRMR